MYRYLTKLKMIRSRCGSLQLSVHSSAGVAKRKLCGARVGHRDREPALPASHRGMDQGVTLG